MSGTLSGVWHCGQTRTTFPLEGVGLPVARPGGTVDADGATGGGVNAGGVNAPGCGTAGRVGAAREPPDTAPLDRAPLDSESLGQVTPCWLGWTALGPG